MSQDRRGFILKSLGAVAAIGLGRGGRRDLVRPAGAAKPRSSYGHPNRASEPLRILILGGTGFIGPHQVRYAIARGHTLTLFNRGRTNADLFPEVERLVGDRDDDLTALETGEWDVVIDNSASIPRWVRQSAGMLADRAEHYLYVSSISAYASFAKPGLDEDDPVATTDDPTVEEITGATYGPLKALCEDEARRAFPDRATIVRPGLIVGPGDPTDRFTYWPVRVARGGEVLAPGTPEDLMQVIDARDLTEWMVRMVEERVSGTFNATGHPTPMGEALEQVREGTGSNATFTWADADFLAEQNVRSWSDMPAWVPPRDGFEGFGSVSIQRALDQGLEFRPLADTARDTVGWWRVLPAERRESPHAGLDADREAEVLAAWDARDGG